MSFFSFLQHVTRPRTRSRQNCRATRRPPAAARSHSIQYLTFGANRLAWCWFRLLQLSFPRAVPFLDGPARRSIPNGSGVFRVVRQLWPWRDRQPISSSCSSRCLEFRSGGRCISLAIKAEARLHFDFCLFFFR